MDERRDRVPGGADEAERLRAELAEALRENAAKEQFLSSMSHDIRTPMNAIVGLTALAKKHIDEKKRVLDALDKIETASGHLISLINDVLDMSRINSGRMTIRAERFSLSDLLHDILIIVRPQISQKGHAWRLTTEGIEAETLDGDALRLRQIYVNIINNAVKYTPDGGHIEVHLSQRFRDGKCELLFRCTDDGVGMSQAFLERIFDPFERVAETAHIEGTGLGMSIVKKMTDAMGGDISVESEPGKGTTVRIRIPLDYEQETEQAGGLEGRRILILEADGELKERYRAMLPDAELKMASSPAEALSALTGAEYTDRTFHLAVIGNRWEGGGSLFDTAGYLHQAYPEVPLVLVSEADWERIEYAAQRSGIRAFIPLPFFRKTLREGLRAVMEESRRAGGEERLNLEGKRILLAEDNLINREIAVEILRSTGAQIDTAEDGEQAVKMYLASAPGTYFTVLMDVQMPKMDGYAATGAIRESGRPDAKTVPILAMTANTFAEDIARAKEAGMDGHMAKPIDIPVLMQTLGKLAGRK